MFRIVFILNLLTLCAYCADTVSSSEQDISQAINQISYNPNWFSLIFGMLVVIALIYFTGFIYQKMIRINFSNKEFENIRADILSTTSLGQGRSLHVISVGSKKMLIGSTQNNISYISDITNNVLQGGMNDSKNS